MNVWSKNERYLIDLIRFSIHGSHNSLPPNSASIDDCHSFITDAKKHNIEPWVYSFLYNNDMLSSLPSGHVSKLKQRYMENVKRSMLQIAQFSNIANLLSKSGIECLAIKGASLRETIYEDSYARKFGDIDLLIHESQLETAAAIFAQAGYSRRELSFSRGILKCDLHIGIGNVVKTVSMGNPRFIPIPDEWWWGDSRPARDFACLSASPLRELIVDSLHYSIEHCFERLLWGLDLLLTIKKFGKDIDPEDFINYCRQFRIGRFIYVTFDYLNDVFDAGTLQLGSGAKASTLKNIASRLKPGIGLSGRNYVTRCKKGLLSREEQFIFLWHISGNWPLRAKLLRKAFFPSRKFMQGYYGITRKINTLDYVKHIGRVVRKAVRR